MQTKMFQLIRPVTRLLGMRDLSHEEWRRKRDLQERLARLLDSYGYRHLDTPIL